MQSWRGAWPAGFGGAAGKAAVIGIISTGIVLHAVTEGLRWQMVPLYIILLGFASRDVIRLVRVKPLQRKGGSLEASHGNAFHARPQSRSRIWTGIQAGTVTVGLLLASALPVLLPVPRLPEPDGPYAIGTLTYHWVDRDRQETLAPRSVTAGPRELMAQIWYPAQLNGKETRQDYAPYVPDLSRWSRAVAGEYPVPAFLLSHLSLVKTHAVNGAEVSEERERYPVILFSHGFPGTRFTNGAQLEEWASQGFIVVSIEHAYSALATVFPDGRTAMLSQGVPEFTDNEGWDEFITEVWTEDVRTVLKELKQVNRQDPHGMLTDKLDLERIGMAGHSFGGATAVQALMAEPDMKAALNMDGSLFGGVAPAGGIGKPLLIMTARGRGTQPGENAEEPTDAQLKEQGINRETYQFIVKEMPKRKARALRGGGLELTITPASHMSFSDYHLLSPLLAWMDGVEPMKTNQTINNYATAFFKAHLYGTAEALLKPGKTAGTTPAGESEVLIKY
ncbi:hypothetical protein SY83_15755 [Paenibacillus swuensis]|uniref:Acetylhydrolase n=1 Tax=Paenibacillus swuensis TaxID=1178515 RepID=A0A172TPW9_9BACL|nr:hypothetical protein SY83_15755 [Paenibacillus swuensis]